MIELLFFLGDQLGLREVLYFNKLQKKKKGGGEGLL